MAPSAQPILIFACRDDDRIGQLNAAGYRVIAVACMGQIPPSFLDFALSRGHAQGVFLLGCGENACDYRFGADWTGQRIARTRDPMLRRRVDTSRVAQGWQHPWSEFSKATDAIDAFARSLGV